MKIIKVFLFLCWVLALAILPVQSFANAVNDGVEAYQQGNYWKAFELWQPVAQQGDPVAQYNMGVLYINGQGFPKNVKQAIKWFEMSAEQGYANAQYVLGNVYYHKIGCVERSLPDALKWYRKGANNGSEEAEAQIKKVYTDLFPIPSASWSAGDVEVIRTSKDDTWDKIMEHTNSTILTRIYTSQDSNRKVSVRIVTNQFALPLGISLVHNPDYPESQNFSTYQYGQYRGTVEYNEKGNSIEYIIEIKLEENPLDLFIILSGPEKQAIPESLANYFFQRIEFKLIADTLAIDDVGKGQSLFESFFEIFDQ